MASLGRFTAHNVNYYRASRSASRAVHGLLEDKCLSSFKQKCLVFTGLWMAVCIILQTMWVGRLENKSGGSGETVLTVELRWDGIDKRDWNCICCHCIKREAKNVWFSIGTKPALFLWWWKWMWMFMLTTCYKRAICRRLMVGAWETKCGFTLRSLTSKCSCNTNKLIVSIRRKFCFVASLLYFVIVCARLVLCKILRFVICR